jgi:hypothetical protein
MVSRRPRTSTICQVHERWQRPSARFYRGNQLWDVPPFARVHSPAGPTHVSQSRLISITKQSLNIKLIVRPFSIPCLF